MDGQGFLDDLVSAGLLVATGVQGVYGRGHAFESVLLAFDALVARETERDGAEVLRFPPVLPRRQLEQSGYLGSFPHLAGSVFSFAGDERAALELAGRVERREDWSDLQTMSDVTLTPAACYPVYPWVATSPLGETGRTVDVCGYCFRHEPSDDPTRLQSFRMHELVRIGPEPLVAEWHRGWVERGGELLRSVGLETAAVPANDPFFGRGGRMLAANQRSQGLKLERVIPIDTEQPTAIMSINYHQDHFGLDFGIHTEAGEVAHTACLGFGLERVTLALLATHGLDPDRWPTTVRERLRLNGAG
jgi:seryl-tRNA synthetase